MGRQLSKSGGFLDVFIHLPKIIKNFFKLKKYILKTAPKIAIFIDSPDFSLRMEKSLKKSGFKGKIVHYISPTIWAWRKSRIKTMNQSLDLLLTIFPFEKSYYQKCSFQVEYVGNPLINYIDQHTYKPLNFELGLFPGSRINEIKRNLPIQLKVAKELNLKTAISISDNKFKELITSICKGKNYFPPLISENYNLMKNLKLAFATSGTITLELALHNVPTIVTYAIKPLDLFIARKILKINLPYYCIVNILANEELFKELYGPNLSYENLLNSAKTICPQEIETKIRSILGNKKEISSLILKLI